MIKTIFFLFCTMFLAIINQVAWAGGCSNYADEANILKKHYPNSYDVETYQDKSEGILNVTYKVHLSFPANELIQYYNKKLNGIGWSLFVQPAFKKMEWHNFLSGTSKDAPIVYQLLATWKNKDKSRMVLLALRYYSINTKHKGQLETDKPNNDILNVALQFTPFEILPDIENKNIKKEGSHE